ncbi:MAG: hypothetical protein AAF497_06870 [Planctomycetota bacterium]
MRYSLSVLNRLIPRTLLSKLAAPFKALGRFLSTFVSVIWAPIRDLLIASPIIKWLLAKLKPLWYPFYLLGLFFAEWFKSRKLSQLYGGIPALILLVSATLLVARMAYSSPTALANRYRSLSMRAAEANDMATVNLCTRKLQQLGVSTEESEYVAALKLEEDYNNSQDPEKLEQAIERMRRLADLEAAKEGTRGFAPAHYWLASRLLNRTIPLPRPVQIARAEAHLRCYDELKPDASEANHLWAQVYSETGRLSASTERIRKLIDQKPELTFDLFSMDIISGDLDNARKDAFKFLEFMETQDRTQLSVLQFIRWAQAYELTGDQEAVRRVLNSGLETWPDDQQLIIFAGKTALGRYDRIANIPSSPAKQRALYLLTALTSRGVEEDAMKRVAMLYRRRNGSRIADETLTLLLDDEKTPATVHLHLGSAAAAEGDTKTARSLVKRSLELAPKDPLAHNNYAWLLANTDPIDNAMAIKLVNRAIELDPTDFRFYETRGKIYMATERWDEAIQDLEIAINGLPTLTEVHDSLAIAYRKIGKPEQARAHEEQVASLRKKEQ